MTNVPSPYQGKPNPVALYLVRLPHPLIAQNYLLWKFHILLVAPQGAFYAMLCYYSQAARLREHSQGTLWPNLGKLCAHTQITQRTCREHSNTQRTLTLLAERTHVPRHAIAILIFLPGADCNGGCHIANFPSVGYESIP